MVLLPTLLIGYVCNSSHLIMLRCTAHTGPHGDGSFQNPKFTAITPAVFAVLVRCPRMSPAQPHTGCQPLIPPKRKLFVSRIPPRPRGGWQGQEAHQKHVPGPPHMAGRKQRQLCDNLAWCGPSSKRDEAGKLICRCRPKLARAAVGNAWSCPGPNRTPRDGVAAASPPPYGYAQ